MRTLILPAREEQALRQAADILRAGGLVAFPTETVYGLGADAANEKAVQAIFAAKGRPGDNPLIVHIGDKAQLEGLVSQVPGRAARLMEAFWPGPLTLVMPRGPRVPDAVSASLPTVAVRLPAHPDAQALIQAAGLPIAAPSANRSGRPSTTTAAHVYDDLNGRIPLILDGGPCQVGVESTVVDTTGGQAILLRPGGVTLEQLEAALGEKVPLGHGVMEPLPEGERALSPGLKHTHYAPKARVTVYLGEPAARTRSMLEAYDRLARAGERPVILCGQDARYAPRHTLLLGQSKAEAAHALFAALREADRLGYTQVLAEGVDMDGLGLAVMNRMERAAGFQVVQAG